jgi:hypothetical protein
MNDVGHDYIFHYNIFKVSLIVEFQKTKDIFINKAKNKDAIQAFEFVSAVTNP